jgi:hypothetical protein
MTIILPTWEAEIEKIMILRQLGGKTDQIPSQCEKAGYDGKYLSSQQ